MDKLTPTIVIDVSNLAYRALYSVGELHYDGRPTGVLYGLMLACLELERRFGSRKLVFCFDTRSTKRSRIYPEYKRQRAVARLEEDDERKQARMDLFFQVHEFRAMLPDLGAVNVFREDGYEADDLIASVVKANPKEQLVLVSSDTDLWQLLEGDRVRIWRPSSKSMFTEADLLTELGIAPCQYASVKAWAGCSSDNIIGLKGVGEKTAAKFISGKYGKPERFTDQVEVYNANIRLTKLPYPGCPAARLTEQESRIDWDALGRDIGSNNISIPGIAP